MWTERKPEYGETVKLEYSKWTGIGSVIGIVLKFQSDFVIVGVGNRRVFWPVDGTLYVWDFPKFDK